MENYSNYSPTMLRAILGPLFILPGIMKLMNPAMISGMLGSMGFPAPTLFAWILIISEIGFGLAVLAGFKIKYTVWPLVVILLVATALVFAPMIGTDPSAPGQVLFHLLGIAALVSLFFTGAGKIAVDKN